LQIKEDKGIALQKILWKLLLQYVKIHNVNFIKVKGHSDNPYNNRCDELAREEIAKYKEHCLDT